MLRISGGWFSVRLICELDSFLTVWGGGASYTHKYTVLGKLYFQHAFSIYIVNTTVIPTSLYIYAFIYLRVNDVSGVFTSALKTE